MLLSQNYKVAVILMHLVYKVIADCDIKWVKTIYMSVHGQSSGEMIV